MRKAFAVMALLAVACGDASGPAAELPSWNYKLFMHNSKPVPTTAVCGGYEVTDGRLLFYEGHKVTFIQVLKEIGTNKLVGYQAKGTYAIKGSVLTIEVRGSWTNSGTGHTNRYVFDIDGGSLSRRHVGTECDADTTETYGADIFI